MSSKYDDSQFQVIERKYFGLTKKLGGDTADGYTIGSATTQDQMARWYPKGPIEILKFGRFVLATLSTPATNADVELLPIRLYKSSANGTAKSTLIASDTLIARDTGREALFSRGSKTTMASAEVEAGRFLTIRTASPTTGDGTVDNGTIGGSLAFFIEYKRKYDGTEKHNPNNPS